MKKFIILILTALMVITTVIPTFAANSIANTLAESEKVQLLEYFDSKGILDKNPQLIEKINRGELPDSLNQNKVKEVAAQLAISEQVPYKKYVFPDGSYLERTLIVNKKIAIIPENRSQLLAEIGDSQMVDALYAKVNTGKIQVETSKRLASSDTSYYYSIWIQEDGNATGGGYFADFAIVWGNADYIMDVYDEAVWAIGGTWDITYLGIDRPTEAIYAGIPAQARLSWQYNILGVAGGSTYRTYLYVGNNTYWSVLG